MTKFDVLRESRKAVEILAELAAQINVLTEENEVLKKRLFDLEHKEKAEVKAEPKKTKEEAPNECPVKEHPDEDDFDLPMMIGFTSKEDLGEILSILKEILED